MLEGCVWGYRNLLEGQKLIEEQRAEIQRLYKIVSF